ncbi:MAG TPA: protein-disulfide reductase DsbD domain-containing protein [Rhodanobacteraceae bacterium]|jgi:thiol:disulfide interchange protein DsbD|nr:protein-disulfide reductase DsbD domain-containing protein [Rhodanobacteraceae bacterium]
MTSHAILSGAGAGAALLVVASAAAAPVQADHVAVELVSEMTALVPGRSATLGLRFVHEPHWHTYWINPGDSGLATKLSWRLPPDFRAGEIRWPVPRRFDVGGLFNFGYDGEALLPVQIDIPASAKAVSSVQLAVEARWLVCREECIPGKAMLTLDLPLAAETATDPRWQAAFAAARASQPQPAQWTGAAQDRGDRIDVTLTNSSRGVGLPSSPALDAFVVQRQVVGYAPPQISRGAKGLIISFARSEYFTTAPAALDLLLISGVPPDASAWSVHAPLSSTKKPSL